MKHLKMMMVFAALGISLLSGCGKKEAAVDLNTEQLVTEAATESVEVLETETEPEKETEEIVEEPKLREGMNPLTGEKMDDPAKAKLRPVSFMMGNTKDAMPQYGASKADVIYEVPAGRTDKTDVDFSGLCQSANHHVFQKLQTLFCIFFQ